MTPAAWTSEIKWIFFDVGDTLVDESAAHLESIRQFTSGAEKIGLHIEEDEVLRLLKAAFVRLERRPMQTVMEQLVPSESDRAAIRSGMNYRKDLERPFPESEGLLRRLNVAGYKIGIIANQSYGTAARLASYGFAPYLDVIVSSAEAGVSKPDPSIFLKALQEAGCEPTVAVMIGDRIDNDVIPAKRLGMKAIRILQGPAMGQQAPPGSEAPDATIEQLTEIALLFGLPQ